MLIALAGYENMKKKTNIIYYVPAVIAGLIVAIITDDLKLFESIGIAIVIGFIVGIVCLLGKKLLASMNK